MSLNYSNSKLNCNTRCSVNLKWLLLLLVHMLAVLLVKLTRQEKFNQLNLCLAQWLQNSDIHTTCLEHIAQSTAIDRYLLNS